jgi:tetraacyldisaccharide 4'-kinase
MRNCSDVAACTASCIDCSSMPEWASLQRWVEEGWYDRPPRLALQPLAALYGLAVAARRLSFRSGIRRARHPGVPTVIIGNLTVGGTGKTPLVLWLATRLREQGRKPGIVLRGYGGRQRVPRLVRASDAARDVGDEALLLAQRAACPVATGVRRAQAARLLAAGGCDVILADDGLQHLAMQRDLSVLVIDGRRGFGNGAMLPAGPLREPPSRLRCADLVVLHGEDQHHVLPPGIAPLHMQLAPLALRELATDREVPLDSLRGATVHALAGTGHPARFFALLRALGASPIEHPRADHHHYVAGDLAYGDGHRIVMTEKDAVKCRPLAASRGDLYYLPVAAVLPEADAARLLGRVLALGRV